MVLKKGMEADEKWWVVRWWWLCGEGCGRVRVAFVVYATGFDLIPLSLAGVHVIVYSIQMAGN